MIHFKKYIGMLLLAVGITSCSNEFDRPPLVIPEATLQPNTSILDFKTEYWQDAANYATTIGTKDNGDHIIIAGRVVSSDQTNNIYQSLVIQDETGALAISISEKKLYSYYAVGQRIVLDLTDMTVGKYSGLQQLGEAETDPKYGTQTTRMTLDTFKAHAQTDGMPDVTALDTIPMSLADLPKSNDKANVIKYQSLLVRFDDVTFEGGGTLTYADGTTNTNRTLKSATGSGSITVRNSGYADFASEKLPAGTGSVVGILSYFGSGWQLLLRSTTDCIDFKETPPEPVDPVTSISEDFNAATAIPNGWTTALLQGDKDWYVREFSGNNYASCSGYKGTAPFDSWLISPPVNIDAATAKKFSFRTQVADYGSTTSLLEVYVLTSADPSSATKTKLNPTLADPAEKEGTSPYSKWKDSGDVDLSGFSGTIYIGFRYAATQDANYATWCVDDVKVN